MGYTSEQSSSGMDGSQRLLSQIKEHVVQLEAMVTYVIICVVTLYILSQSGLKIPIWLIPSLLLVGLRPIVRVTNPTGEVRNALVWGGTIGGIAGAIVGAASDIVSGGLTGAQGTLIGYGAGAAAGASIGNWIEGWGKKDELVERGDAFTFLFKYRRRNPLLSNPARIDDALDNVLPHYDPNRDGRRWYSMDDLKRFARRR